MDMLTSTDPLLLSLARSGDHRQDQALMPAHYADEHIDAVMTEAFELLHAQPMMNLSTVTPEGWPVGHCMHFSTVEYPGRRPVIYTFTHESTRKLINVEANPRVSISCYKAVSFERRRETRAFYGLGLAKIVREGPDWQAACAAHEAKPGYEHVKLVREDRMPLLRIDIIQGVWFNPLRKPQHGRIEFSLEGIDGA